MDHPEIAHLPVMRRQWNLASSALRDGYTDFVLARQAMRCSHATLDFYRFTAGAFLAWLELQGVTAPAEVSVRHVREYLAMLAGNGRADTTVHDHARAIRTLLIFWHAEGYLPTPITFQMPKLQKKRLPVLTADELAQVIDKCRNARDKAIVMLMADSGLRREEVCTLNCADIDLACGLVQVRSGKGGRSRSTVAGPTTRRALLAYRRDLQSPICANEPVFLARGGTRLTGAAVMLMFRRLSARTGIHVTAHALRRTFVILYLRAGGDVLHLQAQLGHSSLEMVKHYAQMIDDDLLMDHQAHSPIDNLPRLRQISKAARALPRAPAR